jgi:nucleotide-binding universal stress UspA family protein
MAVARSTRPRTAKSSEPAVLPGGGRARPHGPPPFKDVLCAVDGSRGSEEALHQAIALGAAGSTLHFVAVSNERTFGERAQVDLSEARGREALDDAVYSAHQAGVDSSARLLHGASTADLLLAEAAGHELLAIGCHGEPRLGGVVTGATATLLAHRTEGPLLVARISAGSQFPQSILLATDGSPGSWAAARAATRLSQAHGSELRLVYVPDGMHPERYREVLKQMTVIEKAMGSSPSVADDPGHVTEQILKAADARRTSLIVIGHRGVRGVRALGSVSERIVNRAPCSVLVVPAGGDAA